MRWSTSFAFLMAVVVAAALLTSCDQPASDSTPKAIASTVNHPRIVSLSPAISRTLIDLHLPRHIVGRTPHCAALDQSIPVVGDLLNVNYEQLIRLQPTHILVQPPESGVNSHLLSLAQEHGWRIAQWKLNSLADIETLVQDIPAVLFAEGSIERENADRQVQTVLTDMTAAFSPKDNPVFKGRTLIVYSVSPISVFGEETYLDGVLKSLGGTNATTAKQWITLSLEDLVRLNPEAIVLVKPGAENINVSYALGSIWDLDIAAVNERRLAILGHPDAFMPSTGVIGVAEELRTILESFGDGSQ